VPGAAVSVSLGPGCELGLGHRVGGQLWVPISCFLLKFETMSGVRNRAQKVDRPDFAGKRPPCRNISADGSIFAMASAYPKVRHGDLRGEGSGPTHGFGTDSGDEVLFESKHVVLTDLNLCRRD
jgi:hypothetical protein